MDQLAVNYFFAGNYSGCIETIGHLKIEGDEYLTGLLNDAKQRLIITPK